MRPGWKLACGLALLLSLTAGTRGASFLDTDGLPACGSECYETAAGASDCDPSDTACLCADDKLHKEAHNCVQDSCTIMEELDVSRIDAETCDRPRRDRQPDFFILFIVEVPAAICPFLRLYSRWRTMGFFDIDDWLMAVAGAVYLVFLPIGHYIGQLAFGVDTWTLDIDTVTKALKLFYVDESLYFVCLGLTKVSILFFYLRIFPNRRFQLATYAVMAFIAVPTVVAVFMQVFQCTPVPFAWKGWMDDGRAEHCIDINTLAYIAAGLCIVQDLVTLMLPLPLLVNLQTGRRSKAGIIFMFSLGVFVLVTSCVRVRYIDTFGHTRNPAWEYTDPLIWSGLEVSVSIIVACLPAIRVLIMNVLPGIFSSIGSQGRSGRTGTTNGYLRGSSAESTNKLRRKHPSERRGAFFPSSKSHPEHEENESQIELGLHLGDKMRGEVQTEVLGPQRSAERHDDDRGIRIKTTTTTRVNGD